MSTISIQSFHKIVHDQDGDKDYVFVDVRSPKEYRSSRVPGVENIPLSELKTELSRFQSAEKVFLICHSGMRSSRACEMLKTEGLDNVVSVEGGVSEWLAKQFPVEASEKAGISIFRQVLIAASGLLFVFSALGMLVDPVYHWGAVAVSGGLMFAGVSGICMMATLLEKMPWNR